MTCYLSLDNWLTAAWNTLAFTKFWKSGLAKYVCTNSVFSSNMAATMLMMSSLKIAKILKMTHLLCAENLKVSKGQVHRPGRVDQCTEMNPENSAVNLKVSFVSCVTQKRHSVL